MSQISVGAGECVVEVPLFAELGGYGPFKGRRNIGVRDDLYCRALTIHDGNRRNVVIVTDTILMDQKLCRLMRVELAEDFVLYPDSIMFVATHTHSGPCLNCCDVGYGEASEEFRQNWRIAVRKAVAAALANEEPVKAMAGTAPIRKPIGQRRTTDEDKHTDPEIRFIKFLRPDGSIKLLLHNYAMHGVTFGPQQKKASADWMGDANIKIRKRGLAEMPFFLYGTAGDINVIWTHRDPAERHLNVDWIGTSYVDDLEAALDNCHEINLGPCKAVLQAIEFPTEPVVASEYREIAEKLSQRVNEEDKVLQAYTCDRLEEMATLADRGFDFRVIRDLQVLTMGDLQIYALPGEAFLAFGEELRAKSKAAFPIAVSVANGDAGYLPTRKMFEQYPTIFSGTAFGAFGFYEVWFGQGKLRPKFKPDIERLIIQKLLELGEQ